MKAVKRTVVGWVALALAVGAGYNVRAGEADEAALAERIAALSDRLGNSSGAALFRANMLEGAGRMADKQVRFRRDRYRAAEAAGDSEAMLAAIKDWRAIDQNNLFVQKRQIDLYVAGMETADERLAYLNRIVDAKSVDNEVRSHAAMNIARLLLEQSRIQQAMEMLRKSLLLDGMNIEAMRLHWQISADRATPAQRLDLLLAMLKANPASIDAVLLVAGELADANLVQQSLQWYGHAAGMSRSIGGLAGMQAKDYAAELLIAGQDRSAAEITSRLLERAPGDPGAWFLTLLAEKGMQDRIGEVRKNALIALLNRVETVRTQMGVKGATTRPLGSDDATMPNLSGDAALVKNAAPEIARDYMESVSDVIWFLLFYTDRPVDAQPMLQALAASGQADAALMSRLDGWYLLKSGKIEEARAKLAPLAEKDPLAGIGLVKIYQKDTASATSAIDLAKKLVLRYPSRLIGAMVRTEVGTVAGDVPPDPATAPMIDALDRFPREMFKIALQPQDFLSLRLVPLQVAHDFAEPILVEVELSNAQGVPVVLGPLGIARDYWLDAQVKVVTTSLVSGAVFDKIDGPIVLGPGKSVKWLTRLDRGPLAKMMQQTVQTPMQIQVFGLTNAVPADTGIVPGPCGIRGRMGRLIERRAASLVSDQAIKGANAVVDGSDLVLKMRLIDQLTAHLVLAADPEGPAAVKSIEAELKAMLVRLGQDAAPTVHAWARYCMGQMGVEPAAKSAADLAAEPLWYSRLLGAALTIDAPDSVRPKLLEAGDNDTDATVRRTALSIPAALTAQAESKKQ